MRPVAQLSEAGRRALLDLMLRRVAEAESVVAQPTAAHAAREAAVAALVVRLRALGGLDALAEAYHFDRGTLTRWADAAVGRTRLCPVAAVDAAVGRRLRELGAL